MIESENVIALYTLLENSGIKIWIDGGWSVDALLGKQTRPHKDVDIALQWQDVPRLRQVLETDGYKQIREEGKWNFVLGDENGREIDVHAFIFDKQGNVVEGIIYPADSLTGTGTINGQTVRCIAPKYMVQFLAPWIHKWPDKYLQVVSELCTRFDIDLPEQYLNFNKTVAKEVNASEKTWTFLDGSKRNAVLLKSCSIGLGTYLPGWRWSEHVGNKLGKASEAHIGYIISGKLCIKDVEGTEREVAPGMAFEVGPRHDAWVVGDEPCIALDFLSL